MRSRPLNLEQALASDKLEEFVRQEEARGAELTKGSDDEDFIDLDPPARRFVFASFATPDEAIGVFRDNRRLNQLMTAFVTENPGAWVECFCVQHNGADVILDN